MGASISSLHRLRRQFLIQLFHAGLGDTHLEDIFESFDKKAYLERDDLLFVFGVEVDNVMNDLMGSLVSRELHSVPVQYLISFFENPTMNRNMRDHFQNGLNRIGLYTQVTTVLNIIPGESSNAVWNTEEAVVSMKHRKDDPIHYPMWKKHETNIQERIIQHITYDNEGNIHEMIETDKSQNEVIHVEITDRNIFAHREYTQQEQTEEIDKEVTTFVRATEEFIHLKSENDEYEYVHSEIPKSS